MTHTHTLDMVENKTSFVMVVKDVRYLPHLGVKKTLCIEVFDNRIKKQLKIQTSGKRWCKSIISAVSLFHSLSLSGCAIGLIYDIILSPGHKTDSGSI